MSNRFVSYLALSVIIVSLISACADDEITAPCDRFPGGNSKQISIGELHNELVQTFLVKRAGCGKISSEEYLDLYIKTSKSVFRDLGIDYTPSREELDRFITLCERWRHEGIIDIFDPTGLSPAIAIERMVEAEIIPKEDEEGLKKIIELIKQTGSEGKKIVPRRSSFLPPGLEVPESVRTADDIVVHSCALWQEIYGDVPMKITVGDRLTAEWWKDVTKWIATGICDGLAAWASASAFAGNPAAVGLFTAIASIAAYEAFEERGW